MSKSMAEVLAEHHVLYAYVPAMLEYQWTCTSRECDFRTVNFSDAIAHQAEILAANGYGKLGPTQFVLREREAELLKLKGPCSNKTCPLHYAHSGPCDTRRPE